MILMINEQVSKANELEKNNCCLPASDIENIKVEKNERFTRINIKKNFNSSFCGKNNTTYVETMIKKDKLLNTKETHIKKIFVCESDRVGFKNVVIRDIVIDCYNNENIKSEHSATFKIDNEISFLEVLEKLLGKKENTLLLLN